MLVIHSKLKFLFCSRTMPKEKGKSLEDRQSNPPLERKYAWWTEQQIVDKWTQARFETIVADCEQVSFMHEGTRVTLYRVCVGVEPCSTSVQIQ